MEGGLDDQLWLEWFPEQCSVIVVWGENSLGRVTRTTAIRARENTSTKEEMFRRMGMRVVVFDSNPPNLLSAEYEMFGGRPTFVIDMTQRNHMETLLPILRRRQNVICLHVPFYLGPLAHHIHKSQEIRPLLNLLDGSLIFATEQAKLEALGGTVQLSQDNGVLMRTCSSCMMVLHHTHTMIRHYGSTCSEGHLFCRKCEDTASTCYHHQHKRSFNLPTERVLEAFEGDLFFDDDEDFLF